MVPPHRIPPTRRARLRIAALILLLLGGAGVYVQNLDRQRPPSSVDRAEAVPPRPPEPPLPPSLATKPAPLPASLQDSPEHQERWRKWKEAFQNDGRRLDPKTVLAATPTTHHKIQLALDELASFDSRSVLQCYRTQGAESRADIEAEINRQSHSSGRAVFPVFYVVGGQRVPGNRRILTGELVAALRPGVPAQEIGREYDLAYREPPPNSRLVHFFAQSAFAAIDKLAALARDARLAFVDHDLISFVQAKATIPDDPLFGAQWHLSNSPNQPATVPYWDIHLFPDPLDLLDSAPVWGDFEIPTAGVRGRGIRVGVVDDGIDLQHPDLQPNLAPNSEQHAYDFQFGLPGTPPQVVSFTSVAAEHQKYFNDAHGTNIAGLIGAAGNNGTGTIGVAPESELVGIRALSYYEDEFGDVFAMPTALDDPLQGNYIAPMADVLFAAAYAYLQNANSGYSFGGRTVYPGTPNEAQLPGFGDISTGNTIHIKNNSWGAPDFSSYAGPGPELAGVVENGVLTSPGTRRLAVRDGRSGLGTVFVNAAGNGRTGNVENVNSDGWANARETICVGALALPRDAHFDSPSSDHVAVYSEWGSCVMVTAPGGGPYIRAKGTRTYNGLSYPPGSVLTQASLALSTTDWSLFQLANPSGDPPFEDLYGLNNGTGAADYSDGNVTRFLSGSSGAAAIVSGVAALVLEANPRLSWLDVQNVLIRTAKNHLDPISYALDPTSTIRNAVNGVDIADTIDVVPIDRDWKRNGAFLWFNHKYGAGMVNAKPAVALARTTALFPRQSEHVVREASYGSKIALTDAGTPGAVIDVPFVFNNEDNFIITHVGVHFDHIQTSFIGDMFLSLKSPSGMESILMEPQLDPSNDLLNWTYSSVQFWGENPTHPSTGGTWTLRISDNIPQDLITINPEGSSALIRVRLYGYIRAQAPDIINPESDDPAAPTPVAATRSANFNFSMSATNNPTTWIVIGLPPGLELAPVIPNETNTYLPTRVITGVPTVAGPYAVTVIARNTGGDSEIHYMLITVTEPDDCYTDWAETHFGADPGANPDAAGTADPDLDSFTNTAEFALGLDPGKVDQGFTVSQDSQSRWTVNYRRFIQRGSGGTYNTYQVEASDDLQTWTLVASSGPTAAATTSADPGYEAAEGASDTILEPCGAFVPVTVTNLNAAPARFFRLKIIPFRDPLNP